MHPVRQYYDYVDRGDLSSLINLFAEEVIYHRPGYAPIVGRPALEEFYRQHRVIESGRHELTEVVEENDRVAVRGHFAGSLKDGRDVQVAFADFFRIDAEGLFVRRDTYFFTPAV
ncbi:ketosteroid isomerase-like protein [Krasilnikovia cinnamomea]|uniref:Ketosteroid isomerase-like protein n=1 Tax=Krasilnikovia cinnamomea TaxID=349313 RepID=A0A4Q7ZQ95_9ACTN|nr:nuclear transport factor 2 family protein [Krasilnikovia cinnamomea]RZU53270.1 ketosteroid isomerase-like protein [Krasilnikovia cinnamomea]